MSRLCLVWAENTENADSAKRCRFRNSPQKRASDLDPTYVWIPKLDVSSLSQFRFNISRVANREPRQFSRYARLKPNSHRASFKPSNSDRQSRHVAQTGMI